MCVRVRVRLRLRRLQGWKGRSRLPRGGSVLKLWSCLPGTQPVYVPEGDTTPPPQDQATFVRNCFARGDSEDKPVRKLVLVAP